MLKELRGISDIWCIGLACPTFLTVGLDCNIFSSRYIIFSGLLENILWVELEIRSRLKVVLAHVKEREKYNLKNLRAENPKLER